MSTTSTPSPALTSATSTSTSTGPSSPAKGTRARGSNRQPAAPRYLGRNPRAVRKLQHVVFTIKGRDLTAAERGACRFLCSEATSR